jgi:putative flavoprotein involved in K+ transport
LTHTGSANQEIAAWLSQLDRVLSNGNIEAAMELFLPDSYWRDIIAFTWNIHTAEGPDAIRKMLQACLHHTKPGDWQADEAARRVTDIVEGAFTFNTASGRGDGVVRIKDGRCWTMLTTMSELKGFEEPTRDRRPVGLGVGEYHPGRTTWNERRHSETTELGVTEQPYCLVVGAGHCGLALGARLKQLNVPTLLIDRLDRPSDVWRNRYDTLVLNSPSGADAMPYLSYPENWPAFPSKDQVANWLDAYASIMELNIWGGAECRRAAFDEAQGEWNVDVLRHGRMTTLRPKQLVFATGLMGRPHIPAFPGASSFKGEQLHSSAFRTSRAYAGQRCVVVGADVSGHDICAALWEAGADVTMVQRSPTIIVQRGSLMTGFQELYSDEALKHGITPEKADLLFASVPFRLMERQQTEAFSEIRRRDADFYQQLENAGFQLSYGKDNSGLVPQIFRRGAGYYVNVGASELIIQRDIKLRSRVEIEAINERGLQLSDGSELAADVIIYATGYDREKHPAWQILPERTREMVGRIYGYGSGVRGDPGPWDGELRNLWKPTHQRSLWFHVGGFIQSRFYSRVLALQIKAREAGIQTPVYKIPEARC